MKKVLIRFSFFKKNWGKDSHIWSCEWDIIQYDQEIHLYIFTFVQLRTQNWKLAFQLWINDCVLDARDGTKWLLLIRQ